MENISNEEKVKQSQEALQVFFDKFGANSIYKLVFLETVFEEMFKQNNILLWIEELKES